MNIVKQDILSTLPKGPFWGICEMRIVLTFKSYRVIM